MKTTHQGNHILLSNAGLKNPYQIEPAIYIHDRKQVIPSAFTLHPDILYVQANIFQGPARMYPAELNEFTFAFGADFLAKQKLVLIHQPVHFLVIDQVSQFLQLMSGLMISISRIGSAEYGSNLF